MSLPSGFEKVAPVVLVEQRRRPGAERGRLRYVLYPAYAYRIIAPRTVSRELNILQRAVLGLCRAGVVRATEIGGLLKIHEDLAARVLQALQGARLLDHGGAPTPRGVMALGTNVAEGAEQPIAGYVFQDPWTRQVWPRFVERLVYADTVLRPDGFADLLLGTSGDPRQEQTYTVWPREQLPASPPSATEILEVVRRHGRLAEAEGDRHEAGDQEAGETRLADAPRLELLTHVEPEPRALYLAMRVFAPEVPIDGALWEAADPFGGGRSRVARDALARRRQVDPGLDVLLNGLLASARPDAPAELGDLLARLEEAATQQVEQRLSTALRGTPLFAHAIAMERARLEAVEAGERCPPDKLDDVLLKVQKVVEQMLGDLQLRHPAASYWRLLHESNRAENARTLDALARNIGFAEPLPPSLTGVRQGKVRQAAERNSGSLRPRLIAAMLAAGYKLMHPLRSAAAVRPRLLHELDALALLRDGSGHAERNGAGAVTIETVLEQAELAYITVQLLSTDPALHAGSITGSHDQGVA